ncbi:MAG: hypothetical protein ACOYCB_13765 [Fastidiosipilaceae bacterium]
MTYPKQIYAYRLRAKHTLRGVIAAIICSCVLAGCCDHNKFRTPPEAFNEDTFISLGRKSWDHGYVHQGAVLTHAFPVTNHLDVPVVLRIRPQYRWLWFDENPVTIPENGTKDVVTHWDTTGQTGHRLVALTLQATNTDIPDLAIEVVASPVPPILLSSPSLDFGLVKPNQGLHMKRAAVALPLMDFADEPILECSAPFLSVDWDISNHFGYEDIVFSAAYDAFNELCPGSVLRPITVTLDTDAPFPLHIHELITISLRNSSTSAGFSVFGQADVNYDLNPRELIFTIDEGTQFPKSKTALFTSNEGGAAFIKDLTCDRDQMSAVVVVGHGDRIGIELKLAALTPISSRGYCVIHTLNVQMPGVVVPFQIIKRTVNDNQHL